MRLRFRNGGEILTLIPEKVYDDGWVVGWCPERENNMWVHPANVLQQSMLADITPANIEVVEPNRSVQPSGGNP